MIKKVAVFTAWPDLVDDRNSEFEMVCLDSCAQLIENTFASTEVKANLMRYVAWTHDRNWYQSFDYCLFINSAVRVEVSDFLQFLDSEHTTYVDADCDVIFYQKAPKWQEKIVNIEKVPDPVGVIFIDCWQQIADQSSWPEKSCDFDFYRHMKNFLSKYKIKNKVFHTGEFGNLPLATELKSWRNQPESTNIMKIDDFQNYYQSQKICNWIVVGAHWQQCTHNKPLGFKNLLQLKKQDPNLRIYSHQNCTVKFFNNDIDHPIVDTVDSLDYQQDTLTWKPNGNLFELVSQ